MNNHLVLANTSAIQHLAACDICNLPAVTQNEHGLWLCQRHRNETMTPMEHIMQKHIIVEEQCDKCGRQDVEIYHVGYHLRYCKDCYKAVFAWPKVITDLWYVLRSWSSYKIRLTWHTMAITAIIGIALAALIAHLILSTNIAGALTDSYTLKGDPKQILTNVLSNRNKEMFVTGVEIPGGLIVQPGLALFSSDSAISMLPAFSPDERLWLAHNHPGELWCRPSQGDIETTYDMVERADKIGSTIVDHIIVCENGNIFSFAENGLLE